MSNYTTSRLGQVNAAGSANALFLTQFGGEILAQFEEFNVMMSRHMVRTVPQGQKAATFPATGKPTAAYHVAGTELTGAAINHNEKVIYVDDPLVAHTFVAEIDELKNYWDVRGQYARSLAEQLANTADKQILQVAVLAARASANVTGGDAGSTAVVATARTVGADLASAIFTAAQKFDERNVPASDRIAIVRPAQYYLLGQTTLLLDKDWGGDGSYSEGKIRRIAGIELVKSNHLPITDLSGASATGQNNTYAVNAANTACLCMHGSAVGTTKLMDLAASADWIPQNLATLLVAKYVMGHGILRPESAHEITVA